MTSDMAQAGLYLALYPVNTLNDVAKIFFLIDEHELWNSIMKS